MKDERISGIRRQEEEVMDILLSSSLFVEMSELERQKLLRYLVASYFQPRKGENCRAHLRASRPIPSA
jgi:hypothetical protein